MKKIFTMTMMLMMAVVAFAQEKDYSEMTDQEFFMGEWVLSIEGLPTGDTEMLLTITTNEEGAFVGTIGSEEMPEKIKLDEIQFEDGNLTVTFTGQGFVVPISLDRKDDGTVEGAMNDMFDITGKRPVKKEENPS